MDTPHIAVLFEETTGFFKDIKEGTVIDCTVGYGSHSEAILKANPHIRLICNDRDDEALAFSQKRLAPFKDRVTFQKGNFKNALDHVEATDIRGILADFGISSLQIDKKERGFSFESETLDMRMDQSAAFDAKELINRYTKDELEKIFREYGEIREAKKLASIIAEYREKETIQSAKQLVLAINQAFKRVDNKLLAKIFQAIRIEVNGELDAIGELLDKASALNHCIIACISFHSLEDRIVKQKFKEWTKRCICPPDEYRCVCGNHHQKGMQLTKKPIVPTAHEIKANPRSRSSKLRVFRMEHE